ncbi:ATP synthase subunit beta, mitochondrial-like [Hibiscus syriacus]|uniref:ATP synthase subunit beta, mitochondrial-like n=1 Tax=Hibiscus syriacus TaxID=106335 RepID=UPI001920D5CB|nr:ATP synthase subunit beta, mitochondrial-like [Hibiscus syriacus]
MGKSMNHLVRSFNNKTDHYLPIHIEVPTVVDRATEQKIFVTGHFGGASVGNTLLIMKLINNVTKDHGHFLVFASVEECTREGSDLYKEKIESSVIKLRDKQVKSKCSLVYGQMNELPGARGCVGFTDLTMAERFLDVEDQDLLDGIPSVVGYQPILTTNLGCIQERIATTKKLVVVVSSLSEVNLFPQLPD